jgi:hypothetical protein
MARLRHVASSIPRRLREAPRAAHAVGFGAFLLVYAYLLRDVTVGQLYTFGDFAPFYGERGLAKLTHTWVNRGLGFSYLYHALPVYAGAVTLVGGALAQNLAYLSLIPAGYLAFVFYSGRLLDSLPARHLAAFVYAVNPLVVGEFVNGGVAALVGYAGLPVVLYYLYEIAEADSWTATLKTGAAFGGTTISSWLGFWMVAPFATHLLYRTWRRPRTVCKLCASGVLGVLLSLPSVQHVVQRALGLDSGRAVLESTFAWNYAEATPLAVARLAGNHGVMAMNRLGYNGDPALMIGLIIPGVGLLAIRRRRFHPYYHVAAVIVAFVVLTKHGYTDVLFETLPPLWSLRNPVKLQYPLLVCLALLFGAGMETVLDDRGRRAATGDLLPRPAVADGGVPSRRDAVVVALVLLALFSYAAPASGALGLETVRGDDYYVPQAQEDLGARLDGSVFWVPYGYTTQLRLRYAHPDHVGIKSGGVLHDIQNARYVTDLYRGFVDDPAAVRPQLARQGVRYVVVESDPPSDVGGGTPRVVERWGAPWLWGSPGEFERLLEESPGYERAFAAANHTVYRVEGARSTDRFEHREGLHRLYYPAARDPPETRGPNLVENGEFDDGLEGWWAWRGTSGTQTSVVETSGGEKAARMVTTSGELYPIAQSVDVGRNRPYRLRVDAEGNGKVFVFWYNSSAPAAGPVSRDSYSLDSTPRTIFAEGDRVSIRIRPNATRLTVDRVDLRRTTYPPAIGFGPNLDGVPGAVVDGRRSNLTAGSAVAVNLDPAAAERVGADVRVRDAETVLDGELVFEDTYRQGAGVLLPDGETPAAVPEGARTVTYDHPRGTVLDYWVVGEFDRSDVTVLHTSYDERWVGPRDATHFRADGWANGYLGADPDEIRWTGDGLRRGVAFAWGLSWASVLGCLGVLSARRRRGDGSSERAATAVGERAADARERATNVAGRAATIGERTAALGGRARTGALRLIERLRSRGRP